ncbi:MAG: methyl-accepting chemotaxis protein [Desulfobulbaceae bacterium]|nr:methyl-accepting chemotaxis protein [Desulfobulbaceae bacterium]
MKIGAKLIGGFCVVAALVAVVGGTGMFGIHKVGKSADIIMDREVPLADAAMEAMTDLVSGRDLLGEFLLTDNPEQLDQAEKEFSRTVDEFDKRITYIIDNSGGEVIALSKEADEYHGKFEESAIELMNDHRQSIAADAKMDTLMESFDEHVGELKTLLESHEAKLTKGAAIDKRVDASMEAKTIMTEQRALVEEYAGLHSLNKTGEIRKSFAKEMHDFDAIEQYLTQEIRLAHQDFCELAMGKGNLFDQKDEALQLLVKTKEHMALADEFSTHGDLVLDKVDAASSKNMQTAMQDADAAQSISNKLIIVISVVAFFLAIGIGVVIGRGIALPLKDTVHMIEEMEKGHLDRRLNLNRKDEIGQMATVMDRFSDSLQKEMVAALDMLANGDLTFDANPHDEADAIRNSLKKTGDDLNVLITDILTATEQVTSGAGEVSDSSQALSQGATEQAASLEQITSSMTEMGSQTKLNAENATQANQLANQTRSAAEGGNAKMQEMVSAMGEINEAGQNISKIIKVIDEIAFQTNLLALNAAVEAARAGRHGKGFAVVAEEVRNLAARSAKAAKETAELIEGSVEKTKNGTAIAEATSEALAEIVTSVTKVTDLVGEIAAASNEQAQGINQTNQALNQIDQVTQQNTASAEESAAASEELSGQAMHMKEMMARFKVRDMALGYQKPQPALPASTGGNG